MKTGDRIVWLRHRICDYRAQGKLRGIRSDRLDLKNVEWLGAKHPP